MASQLVWFLLLPGEGSVRVEDLEEAAKSLLPGASTERRGPGGFEIQVGGVAVGVALARGRHVQSESSEIALRFGAGRADKERIARVSSRIEVACSPRDISEVFNDVMLLLGELEQQTGGVLFDATAGEFI